MANKALLTEQQPQFCPTPTRRILVVDDELMITWLLCEALERIPNCQVLAAMSGEEAVALCESGSFDLVLTDYKMPGIDGLTLAAVIRHLQPGVAIILLTGHANEALYLQAAALSIRHVLNKPLRLSLIRQIVLEVFAEIDQHEAQAIP